MDSIRSCFLLLLCLGTSLGQSQRPNILLIMADDLGYSDLGSYGSEIDTPHLDRLATNGLRFTQFYNTGRCCPTRAALLTGLYPHQAGMGWMTAADMGRPGYEGELSETCVTLAELLKSAGYGTYMSGKWHLTRYDHYTNDSPKDSWPLQRGFDSFYGTLKGGGNYFAIPTLTNNNEPIKAPDKNFYYTDAITTAAASFIKQHLKKHRDTPFFCYVSYTAPHFPLHALHEDIDRYRERYHTGWDLLREERFLKMQQLGLLNPSWKLADRPENLPAWSELPPEERTNLAQRMAIYAAQVDRMDQGIGELIETLESRDQLDNTLILFLSDNGATAEGGHLGFERNKDGVLGEASSFASYGQGWAHASNTPFRGYKKGTHEGGIATPLILHWPNEILERGQVRRTPAHIIDLMPTLTEVGRAAYPRKRNGKTIPEAEGNSLVPVIRGMAGVREPVYYWEHEGNRAVRRGDWKLVAAFDKPWELYHLAQDRTETIDLAHQYPAVVSDLTDLWNHYAKRTNVLPLDGRPWGERVPPAPKQKPNEAPEETPATPRLSKPNFIVILCDDLGYGDLGCFGSDKHRTPHIDRMAEEGMTLTRVCPRSVRF